MDFYGKTANLPTGRIYHDHATHKDPFREGSLTFYCRNIDMQTNGTRQDAETYAPSGFVRLSRYSYCTTSTTNSAHVVEARPPLEAAMYGGLRRLTR